MSGKYLYLFLIGLLPAAAYASPMTYQPKNPAFGGSPLNQAGLMSEATAQRQFQARQTQTASSSTNIGNLVLSSVASQMTTKISNAILDKNSPLSGTFNLGNGSSINYTHDLAGNIAHVTIISPDGGTTTIDVPLNS